MYCRMKPLQCLRPNWIMSNPNRERLLRLMKNHSTFVLKPNHMTEQWNNLKKTIDAEEG